ncbi:MAG: hypothetical protein NC079_00675 [Clostridium sp.]|nr:hypothetical protein [Acetatifactor muris]MCM1527449.1 hypothetical protein [Bacteroides sp.]MCM1562105.1 hypothetical protein [Clostridium sp.]
MAILYNGTQLDTISYAGLPITQINYQNGMYKLVDSVPGSSAVVRWLLSKATVANGVAKYPYNNNVDWDSGLFDIGSVILAGIDASAPAHVSGSFHIYTDPNRYFAFLLESEYDSYVDIGGIICHLPGGEHYGGTYGPFGIDGYITRRTITFSGKGWSDIHNYNSDIANYVNFDFSGLTFS